MTFPVISAGHVRLDEISSIGNVLPSLLRSHPDTAPFSLCRLQLNRLREGELSDVEDFIRAVKTRGFWSVRQGRTALHHCLLIEARRADWHGRDDISGWIVFSSDSVDSAASGPNAHAAAGLAVGN